MIILYDDDAIRQADGVILIMGGKQLFCIRHNFPAIVSGTQEQIGKLIYAWHNVVYYEPYVTPPEKPVELTGALPMRAGQAKLAFPFRRMVS